MKCEKKWKKSSFQLNIENLTGYSRIYALQDKNECDHGFLKRSIYLSI